MLRHAGSPFVHQPCPQHQFRLSRLALAVCRTLLRIPHHQRPRKRCRGAICRSRQLDAALVGQCSQGGAIDPTVFTESDGTRYLLWKNDGKSVGQTTWIYIQPLSADGLSLAGSATQLIRNGQPWEGNVIEGPTLYKHN